MQKSIICNEDVFSVSVSSWCVFVALQGDHNICFWQIIRRLLCNSPLEDTGQSFYSAKNSMQMWSLILISVVSFLFSNTCTKLKSSTKHKVYETMHCNKVNASLLGKKILLSLNFLNVCTCTVFLYHMHVIFLSGLKCYTQLYKIWRSPLLFCFHWVVLSLERVK